MRNVLLLPALCYAKRCDICDLQLFGEGGAGGAAAATAAGTGETTGEAPAAQNGGAQNGRDAAAPCTPEQAAADTPCPPSETSASAPDKTAEFEKLIRGEYKEQFAAKTQHILSQRFRENKAQAAQSDEQARRAAAQRENAAEAICRDWQRQSESLKATYPKFELSSEVKGPAFAALLKAGVPLKTAYEACHLEELLGGAMQYTADKVAAATAARLARRAARPSENGTTARAGAVMRRDVSQLSRTECEAIERRVAHGERIRF
ncbi:MAG: hypothetical protein LKJ90_10090 [Faecalibacterium sp.]|jgi:hypothetical protein|nr:hypothetical protein [Faecalibacterium sp.]